MYNVITRFRLGDNYVRFGLIQYSDVSTSTYYLNTYDDLASIRASIDGIYLDGSYADYRSIFRLVEEEQFISRRGYRDNAADVLVIFTFDSLRELSLETQQSIILMINRGINVIVVSISSSAESSAASFISDLLYIGVNDYRNLELSLETLVRYISGVRCKYL